MLPKSAILLVLFDDKFWSIFITLIKDIFIFITFWKKIEYYTSVFKSDRYVIILV